MDTINTLIYIVIAVLVFLGGRRLIRSSGIQESQVWYLATCVLYILLAVMIYFALRSADFQFIEMIR